ADPGRSRPLQEVHRVAREADRRMARPDPGRAGGRGPGGGLELARLAARATPMRVGMLAPISWRVPPRHYGPWELVTSRLTEGLVARGVDVTLFASADSVTRAKLEAVCPRPLCEDPSLDAKVWEALHIANAFERSRDADILHNHYDFLPLTYSRFVDVPIVMTIHGFSSSKILPVYERYADRVRFVAISDADRSPA